MASTTISPSASWTYLAFSGLVAISTMLSLYTETWALAAAPVAVLAFILVIYDIRFLYYAFFALLPFSVEIELGSLGTDLPSEPMMLGLTGVAILLLIRNLKKISGRVIYHPLTVLLLMHLSWILITAIFSQTPVFSIKFFLAKLWYVIPFYFLGFYMLRDDDAFHKIFRYIGIFLTVAVSIVLVRHAREGFTFDTSNTVVYPIFRNHVNYAAMIVTVLPYVWVLWRKDKRLWQLLAILILVVGTYFSYTRAAHLCIGIMIAAYFVFKYNFGKIAITTSLILALGLGSYLVSNNNFLRFAPDFNKTISHDNFENLVEATYKLEDISTMERVYRWVAGGYMIGRKPLLGYGPSGFYHNYTKHTVASFETYVSDNPEKSGIHCYYLMTWVEQGTPGLVILLGLCILILLTGERVYRRLTDVHSQRIVMAAVLSTVSICALCLINDLLESDKVGPFFFLNAAIIVIYDLKSRPDQSKPKTNEVHS